MNKETAGLQPTIVGAGFITLDAIMDSHRRLLFHESGGTCGNVLRALSYLGWTSIPLARLGADPAGETVRQRFTASGLQTDFLMLEPGVRTPRVIERVYQNRPNGRDHSFLLRCPECDAFFPQFTSLRRDQVLGMLPHLPEAQVLFFDRTSPAISLLAEHCSKRPTTIYFEPFSVTDPKHFAKAVGLSHFVKYSADRMQRFLNVGEGVESVTGVCPPVEIQTRGQEGLRFRLRGERWVHLPSFTCMRIVDTTGAGDWCSAGLLHAILTGGRHWSDLSVGDMLDATTWAQALAATKCASLGALGLTYLDNTAALLPLVEQVRSAGAVFTLGNLLSNCPDPVAVPGYCRVCMTAL